MMSSGVSKKFRGRDIEFFLWTGKFMWGGGFLKNPSKLKKILKKRGFDPQKPSLNAPLMMSQIAPHPKSTLR